MYSNDALDIDRLSRENDELRQLVKSFVKDEIDYMNRNALGDPEQNHNVKWARRLGIK